ncbi:MAG: hypothetical protein ACRDBG_25350, partial [Waterburya sp.]
NQGNWIGGKRGITTEGVELEELNEREIKALKRQNEKLHGSYRAEEKAAVEATIIGQFILQFKKYFNTYMKNLFASPYTDTTVGRYVIDHNMTKPQRVPVWKWEEEIMEGRLRVLTAAVLSPFKWKETFGTSSTATKQQQLKRMRITELANTLLWMTLILLFIESSFDDDEKESYLYKRLKRLAYDMSQGLNPMDFAATIQTPIAAADKVGKTIKAFSEWIMFDYTETGKRKGASELARNIPILSNQKQIIELLSGAKADAEYLFGIIPKYESTQR